MKALIIGATGATGKDLLNVLLEDEDYNQIVIFVRRPSGIIHPKLVEIITDFNNLTEISGDIEGDVWFSCLGTTLKAAGSKDRQWQIDYEIPARFAEIARKNGVKSSVLLSSYGASANSKVFYSSIKGQLEDHIAEMAFDQYVIFRPGVLLRNDTERTGERVTVGALRLLNSLGLIRKFRPLPTLALAKKMAKAPKALGLGIHIVELDKISGI